MCIRDSFNPDGALGYRTDDAYFADKQVSLARLRNWTMDVLSTLDVTPAVRQANEKLVDKIQMVQDDKNRWALYLKPENEPGYSVYPDKEDVKMCIRDRLNLTCRSKCRHKRRSQNIQGRLNHHSSNCRDRILQCHRKSDL